MIVVDASVLIAHLDRRDAHHDRAFELLVRLADRPLAASRVTVAEVLVGPARAGRLEAAQQALLELGLDDLELGPHAAVGLAELRATTGLRLPDCCVIHAAVEGAAEALIAFDADLLAAASDLGIDTRDE